MKLVNMRITDMSFNAQAITIALMKTKANLQFAFRHDAFVKKLHLKKIG